MEAMRQKDQDRWSRHPDFVYKTKLLKTNKRVYDGDLRIEMYGGKDRGAEIQIWELGVKSTLEHVWASSDDGNSMRLDTVCFWHYTNAAEEYRGLKTWKDALDLMRRNS